MHWRLLALRSRLDALRPDLYAARDALRAAVHEGYEVSLEPRGGRLAFSPRRFVAHLTSVVRARSKRPRDVLPRTLPPAPAARPRVLHLIDGVIVGGSQKLIFDIVCGLHAGWDQRIATWYVAPDVRFGAMPIVHAPERADVARLVAAFPPDVVHLHYWGRTPWVDMALAEVTRLAPCAPVVQNVNTPIPAWRDPRMDAFVYVSDHARDVQPPHRPGARDVVIHPGTDLDVYRPTPRARAAREEIVGLVYRLEHDKLSKDTIEVLIALARARPSATIAVVGTGSSFAHWVARTRQAGVRERFWFTGLVPFDALPALYDRFTIYLAPVHTESFGLVVAYALAKNIPVVGYRVGALPLLLDGDETLADTPDELVRVACELLADPARREALGGRGRARVERHFSLSAMLDAYDDLYRGVLADSGARRNTTGEQ